MTGCRDIDKNQKCSKNGDFPPFMNPKIFFYRALSLLYPNGALTSCKISEKNDGRSEIFKNRRTDQRMVIGDYIGPRWLNWGPKLS